jgi:endonuclease/exonuclease/phosphatase family metal-dependent hydrolase
LRDWQIYKRQTIKYIKDNSANVILAGDFNATLSMLDRDGLTEHTNNLAFKQLAKIIDKMKDVWRRRNQDERVFSRKRVTDCTLTQSMIDYFLIGNSVTPRGQNVYYNNTTFSDHSLFVLKLD